MSGILYQNPMRGLLSEPESPQGLLGALTVNPLMARQVAAQRAANARPDVTDLFGYGPTWQTYLQNTTANLQAQLPQLTDSGAAMTQKGLGLLGNFAPFGITVFHGSPHRFDKFDLSKVGTGEGAQAYGHGLYFAENRAVANEYAGALSAAQANKPVGNVDLTQVYQSLPNDVPNSLLAARRDFRSLRDMGELSSADRTDFLKAVRNNISASKQGALYKVDLPDEHIAKMLDWDKRLSQQPAEVKNLANKLFAPRLQTRPIGGGLVDVYEKGGGSLGVFPENKVAEVLANPVEFYPFKGEQLYKLLGDEQQASEMLRQAGVPGIRYLDGGSRTGGKGTSNFVVFDDQLPKIIERE